MSCGLPRYKQRFTFAYVRMRSVGELNEPVRRYYVKQALKLDI